MGIIDADAQDQALMDQALELAAQAAQAGEVPVGAIVARGDAVIGRGRNCSIAFDDPSAHAEIVALRDAGQQARNYRLTDAVMYVTLEPCLMCVGALIAARIERLVFGADDPKAGCLGGAFDAGGLSFLNHRFRITRGVRAGRSAQLLRDFFQERR